MFIVDYVADDSEEVRQESHTSLYITHDSVRL